MKPRIVLGLPTDNKIYIVIKSNLEDLGFEVIDVSFCVGDFKYKNIGQRLQNFTRKTFLGDKNFKKKLKFNRYKAELEEKVHNITTIADYALLIRSDVYSVEFLQLLKTKVKKMYGYHWDGLDLYPLVKTVIPYFDRFYLFDPHDLPLPDFQNVYPTTNFYIDNLSDSDAPESDIYHIGFLMKKRWPAIKTFLDRVEKLDLKLSINILFKDASHPENPNVNFFSEPKTYLENMKMMMNSKIILDFLNSSHHGLSLRTFEALGYGKKLITNNQTIRYYDFYNPNNIFVWDGENLDGLEEFINTPYQKPSDEMVKKYSFSNWIRYILEIQPHQSIEFPKELVSDQKII